MIPLRDDIMLQKEQLHIHRFFPFRQFLPFPKIGKV